MKKLLTITAIITIIATIIIFSISSNPLFFKDLYSTLLNSLPFEKQEISLSEQKGYFTCSMHPTVKSEKSEKCPICAMELVFVEPSEDFEVENTSSDIGEIWHCKDYPDVTSTTEDICPIDGTPMVKMKKKIVSAGHIIAKVKLKKSQIEHFNPDIFPVQKMKMTKKLRVLGRVVQPEENESNIPARIGGRVDKIYISSVGSFVSQGDKVVDIYSPELISAGEEFIIANKNYLKTKKTEYKTIVNQARQKLRFYGISNRQINSWYKRKSVPKNITIYSSVNGIVRKKNAVIGKYFNVGQSFYDLVDLSTVWVEMDIYEQDSGMIKINQKIDFTFFAYEGEKRTSRINFISPVLNNLTRTLIVRATIINKNGKLKPGMTAEGNITITLKEIPLIIPITAVINTGKRKVVWVMLDNNKYIAKQITTGFQSEGYVEIKNGLKEGEKVVIEGGFLLDAQARLMGGYYK